MASYGGNFIKLLNFKTCQMFPLNVLRMQPNLIQVRNYAARKGTREKRLKLHRAHKKKLEAQKSSQPTPKKINAPLISRRIDDSSRPNPVDNVVIAENYKLKIYDFNEAVECHRESHHPTLMNMSDALIQAFIELDMKAVKKNRFIDNFSRMVPVPYPFDHGEDRSSIYFCKTPELQTEAMDAGISLAGGMQLIKDIETGTVSLQDYQFLLAHPNILPELVAIRGLMKRRFPNIQNGTLGVNVKEMASKFLNGIKYASQKDTLEEDYGWIETNIGKLDMETLHLQENLKVLLNDILSIRPKRPGPFITCCFLHSPVSGERFKLDLNVLLPDTTDADSKSAKVAEEIEDEDDDQEKIEGKKTSKSTLP